MKKKYLKNIDDLEALRNTDTKIRYEDWDISYYRFVNSVLCEYRLEDDKLLRYNVALRCDGRQYIEDEDEPSKDDIGKLGWFYDEHIENEKFIDVLASIEKKVVFKYMSKTDGGNYQHFRPLTPEEVEEYTGYKVVKEK